MIEQLASLNASQAGFSGIDITKLPNPIAANASDVMKFNLALKDKKVTDRGLLDVNINTPVNNAFLQIKKTEKENPIIKMDQGYRAILDKLKDTSKFDEFSEMKIGDKRPLFRSNTASAQETTNVKKNMQQLLDDTKEMYKASGAITKDISRWQMTTTIWTTNVKILLAVVKQTSTGFKSLFHSAG